MSRWIRTLLALAVVAAAAPAFAAIHVVDCISGPNFTIGSVSPAPYDTVVVHPCTYNESVQMFGLDHVHYVAAENPGLVGAMDVGVGGPQPMPPVIIDGSGTGGPCVHISASEAVSVVGFGMINCDGNGALIEYSGNVTLHGNRIQGSVASAILDVVGFRTTISGNALANSVNHSGVLLENSEEAMVTDNYIRGNGRFGVFISGALNHVANNEALLNGYEGILDQGLLSRIERNQTFSNLTAGGAAELLIDAFAVDADVTGNNTTGSLLDFGSGTELADNF